jgi:acetate kinase
MDRVGRLLHELPLFKDFTPAELESLVEKSRLDTFAPQETIISVGQPGRFLAVILEGSAEAVITNEMDELQRIGLLEQGDFLGEISLLTGEPTVADVIALERCELLLIPQEIFAAFLAVNPNALRVMAKAITERLRWREHDEAAQTRIEGAWRNAPDPYGLRLSTATPMRVLALSCGRSLLQFAYFDTAREADNREGRVEKIGSQDARLAYSSPRGRTRRDLGEIDYAQALGAIAALLTDRDEGVLGSLGELDAVGHKVVHGGDRYGDAVIVDEQVM